MFFDSNLGVQHPSTKSGATGISSRPNARSQVWENFTFFTINHTTYIILCKNCRYKFDLNLILSTVCELMYVMNAIFS